MTGVEGEAISPSCAVGCSFVVKAVDGATPDRLRHRPVVSRCQAGIGNFLVKAVEGDQRRLNRRLSSFGINVPVGIRERRAADRILNPALAHHAIAKDLKMDRAVSMGSRFWACMLPTEPVTDPRRIHSFYFHHHHR